MADPAREHEPKKGHAAGWGRRLAFRDLWRIVLAHLERGMAARFWNLKQPSANRLAISAAGSGCKPGASYAMLDAIWIDANLATMAGGTPYEAIKKGAIGVEGRRIAWVGPQAALPDMAERIARVVHSANGGWITPAFIDCHTHIVFAGDRRRLCLPAKLVRSGCS